MKIVFKKISWCLVPIFLFSIVFLENSSFAFEKKLLIIHSYAFDYDWTVGEDKGIIRALEENFSKNHQWQIERFFFDGKKKNSETQIKNAISTVKQKIFEYAPDAVVITDDLALKSLYRFIIDRQIPMSFCGINGDVYDYGYTDHQKKITGSLERYHLPPIIRILKKIKPQMQKIVLISDQDITGLAMMAEMEKQLNEEINMASLGLAYEKFFGDDYEELKKYFLRQNPETTVVVFVTNYSYKDKNGNPVSYKKINSWFRENTNLADVGFGAFVIKEGKLITLAYSEEEVGYSGASLLFRAIKQNQDPNIYPVQKYLPLNLNINLERAKNLSINIPFELISYSRDLNKFYPNF